MDALIRSLSSMSKRPCPSENPRIHNLNQMETGQLLESLLGLSGSASHCIDLSIERLFESKASDADQALLIDRALNIGSILLDGGKRAARKRASKYNSLAWVLPPDNHKGSLSLIGLLELPY